MNRKRILSAVCLPAAAVLLAGVSGCQVHVEKGANGEDRNVQVDTPFGGVHVNTDQTTAADLGLPAYPGAQIVTDHDNDQSADVHMGFGEWELRVKVVNYATADSRDKVEAFYKKALGNYGDVIECDGSAPVGKPAVTSQGLSCDDHDSHGATVRGGENGNFSYGHGLQLKAGSERHQHIVGLETPENGQTRFALVAVDVPAGLNSGKSD